MTTQKKKLIEVALPLDAINKASAREKSIRHGHPSTLHMWWARRPLAAARAVVFAQMVDDPSAHPDLFPSPKAQEKERQRLFRIIEDLVQWESTTNEKVLQTARDEIWQSWRFTCAEHADDPRAKTLFNRHRLPAFHDPFAGGGALPLEAQRLGLEAHASDLNPVAVLINKAMIELPPKFAGRPPVNPEAQGGLARTGSWRGAQGMAEDVRYYGQWIRAEAEKRIGHLYPLRDPLIFAPGRGADFSGGFAQRNWRFIDNPEVVGPAAVTAQASSLETLETGFSGDYAAYIVAMSPPRTEAQPALGLASGANGAIVDTAVADVIQLGEGALEVIEMARVSGSSEYAYGASAALPTSAGPGPLFDPMGNVAVPGNMGSDGYQPLPPANVDAMGNVTGPPSGDPITSRVSTGLFATVGYQVDAGVPAPGFSIVAAANLGVGAFCDDGTFTFGAFASHIAPPPDDAPAPFLALGFSAGKSFSVGLAGGDLDRDGFGGMTWEDFTSPKPTLNSTVSTPVGGVQWGGGAYALGSPSAGLSYSSYYFSSHSHELFRLRFRAPWCP